MATSLLNDIKTQLTPDMVQHLSSLLGESPANTQKAVDQVLPTLLASVMHLSCSEDGPTRLVNLINHRKLRAALKQPVWSFRYREYRKNLDRVRSGHSEHVVRWQAECRQYSDCQ